MSLNKNSSRNSDEDEAALMWMIQEIMAMAEIREAEAAKPFIPDGKPVFGYTDYPISQLGDEPFKIAPIRKIEVLSYDRNKYCYIRIDGTDIIDNIKRGYIYAKEGRCGEVKSLPEAAFLGLPYSIHEDDDDV